MVAVERRNVRPRIAGLSVDLKEVSDDAGPIAIHPISSYFLNRPTAPTRPGWVEVTGGTLSLAAAHPSECGSNLACGSSVTVAGEWLKRGLPSSGSALKGRTRSSWYGASPEVTGRRSTSCIGVPRRGWLSGCARRCADDDIVAEVMQETYLVNWRAAAAFAGTAVGGSAVGWV
jgi:hypothetical protein